jgi:hypothetical protein
MLFCFPYAGAVMKESAAYYNAVLLLQNSITVTSSRFLHHSNCLRKAEQHYSEQQIPSSQQPVHLMIAG